MSEWVMDKQVREWHNLVSLDMWSIFYPSWFPFPLLHYPSPLLGFNQWPFYKLLKAKVFFVYIGKINNFFLCNLKKKELSTSKPHWLDSNSSKTWLGE